MVRKFIFFVFFAFAFVFATNSKTLAFQGKNYFSQGKYKESFIRYTHALQESKKEADLASESRILTSMAILAIHAEEFEDAEKLLGRVKVGFLDETSKEYFYRTKMEMLNKQEKYTDAYSIFEKNKFKRPSVAFHGEAAIASAALGKPQADSLLKVMKKSDSPGQTIYYSAVVADLQKKDSEQLYEKALDLAVSKNKYFIAGTILLRLAQITGNKDYAKRSANVFKELELEKPLKAAEAASGL